MSKGACQEQSEIREAAERASWWRRLPGLREALYESVIEPPGLLSTKRLEADERSCLDRARARSSLRDAGALVRGRGD